MPKFNIYAGLGGGFGGAKFIATEEHKTEESAYQSAYESAVEEYQCYSGSHGLFNANDALEEDPTLTEQDLIDMEEEDMESWIEYYVKPFIEGEDPEDYE